MTKFCTNCGNKVDENQETCLNCGKILKNPNPNNNYRNTPVGPAKSKIVAGLLGIFLGAFGIHNFYLGYNGKAVAQLLLTVLSCCILSGITALWGFIEGILILCGNIDKDAQGNTLVD